ncbi:hypothetical protein NDU88_004061 [Pleurodeles waltl]|uniref:Uncharacterized protein n=1 Tax=Pleurodeles waltl TaxID=8319 RepID=A0AAV7LN96_PLEWA|nr:hypothetical protein NDU88_004061 [Pleurodeles waltl]
MIQASEDSNLFLVSHQPPRRQLHPLRTLKYSQRVQRYQAKRLLQMVQQSCAELNTQDPLPTPHHQRLQVSDPTGTATKEEPPPDAVLATNDRSTTQAPSTPLHSSLLQSLNQAGPACLRDQTSTARQHEKPSHQPLQRWPPTANLQFHGSHCQPPKAPGDLLGKVRPAIQSVGSAGPV